MAEWQRRFWQNAVSGYLGVGVRMVTGVVMFRLMYQTLPQAHFGFWALLWSIFGYGVLVDFGLGFTAQKAVAEKTATGDISGLNRLLATVFWTYSAIGFGLLVVFLTFRELLLARMGVPAADYALMSRTYIVFFIGMATLFPAGLFSEMLNGLQRIDLGNWYGILGNLLGFAVMSWGLFHGWELDWLMAASLVTSSFPSLLAGVSAYRGIRGLSLSPRWFTASTLKSQLGFSAVAYLVTFSNLLMGKTDQTVITFTLGVALVAIYQAGFKASEMLSMFCGQIMRAISPAAAALNARGDRDGLQALLVMNSRLALLLFTPCYALTAVYLEPLIRLLTGLAEVSRETFWVGQALLLATYSSMLTNGCSKLILMMCGKERVLLKLSLSEALCNLVLSVIFARWIGVLGVAVGTLIPCVIVGWFGVIPVTLRHFGLAFPRYVAAHLRGTWLALLAFLVVITGLLVFAPAAADSGFIALGWRGILCLLPVLWLGYPVIRGITKPTSSGH